MRKRKKVLNVRGGEGDLDDEEQLERGQPRQKDGKRLRSKVRTIGRFKVDDDGVDDVVVVDGG